VRVRQREYFSNTCRRIDANPPPLEKLVAGVPTELAEVIHKCLQKDPDSRYPSIDEVRTAIGELGQQTRASSVDDPQGTQPQEVSSLETASAQPEPPAKPGFRRWWLALAGAVVSAGVLLWHFVGPRADLRERRVEIETSATSDLRSFALSPDASQIAYVANADGQNLLWVSGSTKPRESR
jgi:hypothetical protein